MILPNLRPHLRRRPLARSRLSARQIGRPEQLPGPEAERDQETSPRVTATQTQDNVDERTTAQSTTQGETTEGETTLRPTTVGPGTTTTNRAAPTPTVTVGSSTSSRAASSSAVRGQATSASHSSQATVASETVVSPTQSPDLIVLTTFGPDFPVPTAPRAAISGLGRDYVFIQSSEIADAMLLFAVFCGACFAFTFLLINLTGLSERRRGVTKEDQMVGEDMRWAEGREVVEKRIVWGEQPDHAPRPPRRPGGRKLEASKLAGRQSWGDRKG